MMKENTLKRALGPWLLTFYGLGTIVGAGIYVLIGEVANQAGEWLPLSFLLAGLVASFTAFSYAELAIKFPISAGESAYIVNVWHKKVLSGLVGWAIVLTGVVSAATVANGFVSYLNFFIAVPAVLAIVLLLVFLTAIALIGIRSSAWTIFVITVIELAGLVYFVALAFSDSGFHLVWPSTSFISVFPGVMTGGVLAFFAFIGFEDMVNIVEEVDRPEKSFPIAITVSLVVAILLYVLVGVAATGTVAPELLAASSAPMTLLIDEVGGKAEIMAGITLLAVINGALVQIIMGSRVLYGMACQGMAPVVFSRVNSISYTPGIATLSIALVVAIFSLLLPLATLAVITSLLMLAVFAAVNATLLRLKWLRNGSRREKGENVGFRVPFWVPVAGMVSALLLLGYQLLLVLRS